MFIFIAGAKIMIRLEIAKQSPTKNKEILHSCNLAILH